MLHNQQRERESIPVSARANHPGQLSREGQQYLSMPPDPLAAINEMSTWPSCRLSHTVSSYPRTETSMPSRPIQTSQTGRLWHADRAPRAHSSDHPAHPDTWPNLPSPRQVAHLTSGLEPWICRNSKTSHRFRPYPIPTSVSGHSQTQNTPHQPISPGLIFYCNPLSMGNQVQYLIDLRHPFVPSLIRDW